MSHFCRNLNQLLANQNFSLVFNNLTTETGIQDDDLEDNLGAYININDLIPFTQYKFQKLVKDTAFPFPKKHEGKKSKPRKKPKDTNKLSHIHEIA